MHRNLSRLVTGAENTPLTLASFVLAFFALITLRLSIENTLALFQEHSFFFFFFEFTHTFLFFLCSFLLLLPVVRLAGNIDFRKAASVLLFGFLIILTPPIIDTIIFRGGAFWSFYEFDGLFGLFSRFFTLFGDTPNMGITYGVRVEVVIVTLALGVYTYLKSKKVARALGIALLTYAILFVLGTFPSWLTLAVTSFEKNILSINSSDVAALFLTPENIFSRNLTDFRSVLNYKMSIVYGALSVFLTGVLLYREFPKYFWALWKNARFPQLIYHAGLLFLGMFLALYFSKGYIEFDFFHIVGAAVLLAAVESAWLASVLSNDLYDINIDKETNRARPLIEKTIPPELYRTFGALFFIASLLLSGIMSFGAMLLLLAYQALAWLYSAPPLRLKRFPILATLLASSAGLAVLSAGYVTVAPDGSISTLPLPLLVFLFVGYTLSLPIKDFKDIRGDEKDGVYTIPVLLGEPLAKLVIGSFLFLLFAFSPFVLHDRTLFLPAVLCGVLAFWVIQRAEGEEDSFFSFRKLPGLLLSITVLYGIVLAFILS